MGFVGRPAQTMRRPTGMAYGCIHRIGYLVKGGPERRAKIYGLEGEAPARPSASRVGSPGRRGSAC